MKIILALAMFFVSLVSSASPLNKLVVFGDSLSDNGNLYEFMKHQLPLSPPYYKGRFSNGPVWVELLAEQYFHNSGQEYLLDYAYGGAGVLEADDEEDTLFTLNRELDSYFLTHEKADTNSMFLVWIGSNNYLGVPDNPEEAVGAVIRGIRHGLERLAANGAKHILVVDVPDLGKVPIAREFDAIDRMSYLSKLHNEELEENIADLKKRYPDVQWLYFDINSVFKDMTTNGPELGFTNITDTCYEQVMNMNLSGKSLLRMVAKVKERINEHACDGYLFFDPVHPTAAAHRHMAKRTEALFAKEGVEFEG